MAPPAASPIRHAPLAAPGGPPADAATITHRLHKLGYKDPLPADAVPLVRRLLADLLVTTDTCRTLKTESERWTGEAANIEGQIAPLRSEISRLTAENNHLHRDLVRLADERDAKERRTAQAARRLESQTADLRFVASQYAHRVESEQKRVEQARRKAEEALAKMGLFEKSVSDAKAKVRGKAADANLRAEKLFQRLQKIDIETGLEPMASVPGSVRPTIPDPVTVDVVALAEKRVSDLQIGNDVLSAKNADLETEVDLVRKQIVNREQEIQRLGQQLELARSQQFTTIAFNEAAAASARNAASSAKRDDKDPNGPDLARKVQSLDVANVRIEQLEKQLTYLQEHVDSLEKEIVIHEEDRQTLYKSVNSEKREMAAELQKERQRAKDLVHKISALEKRVGQYNDLKDNSIRSEARRKWGGDVSPTKMGGEGRPVDRPASPGLPSMRHSVSGTGRVDDSTALRNEIKRLQQENAQLSAAQEEETSAAPPANRPVNGAAKPASNAEELESLRAEVRKLHEENQMLMSKLQQSEAQQWATENDLMGLKRQADQANKLDAELGSIKARAQSYQRELAQQQADFERVNQQLETTTAASNQLELRNARLQSTLALVQVERTQLLDALHKFEAQLAEVQSSVEVVTADRDNLTAMYEQINEEVHALRMQHGSSHSDRREETGQVPPPRSTAPPEPSAPAMSPDGRAPSRAATGPPPIPDQRQSELEDEINKLRMDLEATLTREREVREIARERSQHLEAECERLGAVLLSKERELQDALERAHVAERTGERAQTAREDMSKREEALRQQLGEVEINRDKEVIGTCSVHQLICSARPLTGQYFRQTYQLRDLRAKLADAERQLLRSASDCERLQKETERQIKQLHEQKQLLIDADHQRDRDRQEMDRQCEQIAKLESAHSTLQQATLDAEREVGHLREQLDIANAHLDERDTEVEMLRGKLAAMTQDRDRWAEESRRSTEEAHNVGADLAALTKENQIVNSELADVANDRTRLRADLGESERQIQMLDDLLMAKDQEHAHVFAAYRKLASDHERLDMTIKMAGEEGNNLKMEMLMRDKRVAQLQASLDQTSKELTQHRIDSAAFEKQGKALARALESCERTNRHLEADKTRMARDVNAARDLAASLDRAKDDLQQRLTSATLEIERMHSLHKMLDTDRETLVTQRQADKVRIDRLEHHVQMERTRKIQSEMAAQEASGRAAPREEGLNELANEQALAIETLRTRLASVETEREVMRQRIAELEQAVRSGDAERLKIKSQKRELLREVAELTDMVAVKQGVIEDMMRGAAEGEARIGTPGQAALEARIHDELVISKRELRKYEAQITTPGSAPVDPRSIGDAGDGERPASTLSVASGSGLGDSTEDDPIVEEMLAKLHRGRRHQSSEDVTTSTTTPSHPPSRPTTRSPPASREPQPYGSENRPGSRSRPPSTTSTPNTSDPPTRRSSRSPPTSHRVTPQHQQSRVATPASTSLPSGTRSRTGGRTPAEELRDQDDQKLLETIVKVQDALGGI
ncbi:hypothetical protein HKX48_002318 [Thoreauomyces humboldtii]|nr:hypothetical protein HKX48_002318 [Thoreauomyces humboldtii]